MANTDNKTAEEIILSDYSAEHQDGRSYSIDDMISFGTDFANQQNASLINDLKELREKIKNDASDNNLVISELFEWFDELLTKHQE